MTSWCSKNNPSCSILSFWSFLRLRIILAAVFWAFWSFFRMRIILTAEFLTFWSFFKWRIILAAVFWAFLTFFRKKKTGIDQRQENYSRLWTCIDFYCIICKKNLWTTLIFISKYRYYTLHILKIFVVRRERSVKIILIFLTYYIQWDSSLVVIDSGTVVRIEEFKLQQATHYPRFCINNTFLLYTLGSNFFWT